MPLFACVDCCGNPQRFDCVNQDHALAPGAVHVALTFRVQHVLDRIAELEPLPDQRGVFAQLECRYLVEALARTLPHTATTVPNAACQALNFFSVDCAALAGLVEGRAIQLGGVRLQAQAEPDVAVKEAAGELAVA